MKYDLEPAKTILSNFLKEIEEVKQMSPPQLARSFTIKDKMPEFDATEFNSSEDTFWKEEDAYIWLYGDAREYRAFMHRPPPHPILDNYLQPALPVYQQWRQEEKEVFYRKCEQIPVPGDEILLGDYLQKLALIASEGNEHRHC